MIPDSLYKVATRAFTAMVERSTASATSAGVAGSGIRLARESARLGVRAGVRATAVVVLEGSSSELFSDVSICI